MITQRTSSVQGREVEVVHGMTMVFGMQLAVYHVAHFSRKHSADLVAYHRDPDALELGLQIVYILGLLPFAVPGKLCLQLLVSHSHLEDENYRFAARTEFFEFAKLKPESVVSSFIYRKVVQEFKDIGS